MTAGQSHKKYFSKWMGVFTQFVGNEPSILYLSMLSSGAFMARKCPRLTVHIEIGNCLARLIVTQFG